MKSLTDYVKKGYWEIIAAPSVKKQRLDLSEIETKLKKCEVRLRGWPFPFLRYSDQQILSNCIQSITIGDNVPKYEGFQLHETGFFYWKGAMWEDYERDDYQNRVSFTNVNWEITEMLLFLKRLYEGIVKPSEHIMLRINLAGCKGRRLVEPRDWSLDLELCRACAEDIIKIEDTFNASTLNASWQELARKYAKKAYALFGKFDVTEQSLIKKQEELFKINKNG